MGYIGTSVCVFLHESSQPFPVPFTGIQSFPPGGVTSSGVLGVMLGPTLFKVLKLRKVSGLQVAAILGQCVSIQNKHNKYVNRYYIGIIDCNQMCVDLL